MVDELEEIVHRFLSAVVDAPNLPEIYVRFENAMGRPPTSGELYTAMKVLTCQ